MPAAAAPVAKGQFDDASDDDDSFITKMQAKHVLKTLPPVTVSITAKTTVLSSAAVTPQPPAPPSSSRKAAAAATATAAVPALDPSSLLMFCSFENKSGASGYDSDGSAGSAASDSYYDTLESSLRGEGTGAVLSSFGSVPSSSSFSSGQHSLDSAHGASHRISLSHAQSNAVGKMQGVEMTSRSNHTGRDDRATSEQCLDPRTRLILFKMLARGFLSKIDGCLSTGKEANVYYGRGGESKDVDALRADLKEKGDKSEEDKKKDADRKKKTKKKGGGGEDGEDGDGDGDDDDDAEGDEALLGEKVSPFDEYAIKVFKTSILVFKDRDKYVSGEHRWRKGYCKSNPRKMVKVWAEKEMRNYKRIFDAGIKCPRPVLLKNHVLVMEFLGVNGWPSPRLKDADMSEKRLREGYVQSILIMRRMFQRCKLVHGDLSEYNMLFHNNEVYVIDVSQSVESDHPSALDFLRKDCQNVNDFFRKSARLSTMSTRQLFSFVTDPTIADTPEAEIMEIDRIVLSIEKEATALEEAGGNDADAGGKLGAKHREAVNEAVFLSQFLPRSLNQVQESDLGKMRRGEKEQDYVEAVAKLTGVETGVKSLPEREAEAAAAAAKKKKEKAATALVKAAAKKPVAVTEEEGQGGPTPVPPATTTGVAAGVKLGEEGGGGEGKCNSESASVIDTDNDDDESDDDEDGDSDDDDEDDDDDGFVKIPMTPEEVKARKALKKAELRENKGKVKEENKEKRKTKLKKKDKIKAINKHAAKKAAKKS